MATLQRLHEAQNHSRPAVILIHGLGGDPIETWRHEQASRDEFWPHWIGMDTGAEIWTVGYDAALSRWVDQAMPISDQADQLLDRLSTHQALSGRSLILVGHSMGGLVIKTAVVHAMTKGKAPWEALARRLRGVVFIATPHAGSELAKLAHATRLLLRTNEQVGNLKLHDPALRNMNHQFQEQQSRLGFRCRTYAERKALVLPRRFFGLLPGLSIRIVSDTSAEYGAAGESAVPLAEDHFSICKPLGRDQQIHGSICEFINSLEQDTAASTPILQPTAGTSDEFAPGQLRGSADNRLFPREGFVCGREREIDEVLAFLRSQRRSAAICAQVAGAGGIGKTEVCKAALKTWLAERPDALAYYIDVPDNTAAGELPPRIGRALGFEGIDDLSALSLRMPAGLYYLDNLESVAETAEGQAMLRALQTFPGVRLLVSSRVSLPGVMGQLIEIDALSEAPALELFRKLWAGHDTLPEDAVLARFVMDELGGHALSVVLMARLGDCYSYPNLVSRWRQLGTASADSVDRSRFGSLQISLDLTAQTLGTDPGTLDVWTTIALFPGGMPEPLLAELELQGHWPGARVRLIRYHLIHLRDERMHMLPPVARYALDASLSRSGGFDWARARPPVLEYFGALSDAAGSTKSSDSALDARRRLLQVFAALARTMRLELAVPEPEHAWVRKTHEALLNTYQFRAIESLDLLNELRQQLSPLPTSCLRVLGDLEIRLGSVDRARALYEQALALYQKKQDSLGEADILQSLGDLERRLGALDEALALYEQALALYQKELESLGQANTLQALGDLQRRLGALDKARTFYEQALVLFQKEQIGLGQANTLQSLGDLERRLGAVDKARSLYEQALALFQKEQAGLGQPNTLQSLGDLERRVGAVDKARALYEEALALYHKEEDSLGQANTLQSLGDLERRLGALDKARAFYEQALTLFHKAKSGLGQPNTLKSLGDLESQLGAVDKARALYEQALALFQKVQDGLGQANTLQSLGDLERRLGAMDQANLNYSRALELYQREQDPMGYSYTCAELARCAQSSGQQPAAEDFLLKSLQAAMHAGSEHVIGYACGVAVEIFGSPATAQSWIEKSFNPDSIPVQ